MGLFDFLSRKLQRVDSLGSEKLEIHAKEWVNTKPFTLSALRGKVVLVEFASMEKEAKETMHQMNLWRQMFPSDSFQLLSVYPVDARKAEIAKAKLFVNKKGIDYPVAIDDKYKTSDLFKATLRPSFYLFDKKGRLRFCIMSKDLDRVGAAIMRLISER